MLPPQPDPPPENAQVPEVSVLPPKMFGGAEANVPVVDVIGGGLEIGFVAKSDVPLIGIIFPPSNILTAQRFFRIDLIYYYKNNNLLILALF